MPRGIAAGTGHDPGRRLSEALATSFAVSGADAGRDRSRSGTGCRAVMPGSRQVSSGLSAIAVPAPIITASWLVLRSRCARSRAGFAGDPAALAQGHRDLAIEGAGEFQRHERPARGDPHEEAGIDLGRFLSRRARHRQGMPASRRRAMPRPLTRGSGRLPPRGDDAGDSGGDYRVGARRGLAVMAARFQRGVQRGAARRVAGPREQLRSRHAACRQVASSHGRRQAHP